MSNTQVFRIQEEQLNELVHFLRNFSTEINERMQGYQMQVENLYNNGLPQETFHTFQNNHLDETRSMVQQIVNKIDGESIPFIQGNIERLQELMNYNR